LLSTQKIEIKHKINVNKDNFLHFQYIFLLHIFNILNAQISK
jgi:hypothetical protein